MRHMLPLFLLVLAGCSGQGDPCVTNSDCFRGEVCRDGFCGTPVTEIDLGDTSSDDAANNASNNTSNDPGDMAAPGEDAAGVNNSNNENNGGGPDLGRDDDMVAMGPCIADPFLVCVDDENSSNNDFPGVAFDPMTRGCQPSGFVPLDKTISGRQCPLDPEDQYYLTIVECDEDEAGMAIEITLDIKDDCAEELIFFDVESIGTSCANPNPDADVQIRCETLATGERKITTLWPGDSGAVVGSIRWSIQTPDRNDVEFDYDLRVVVREL